MKTRVRRCSAPSCILLFERNCRVVKGKTVLKTEIVFGHSSFCRPSKLSAEARPFQKKLAFLVEISIMLAEIRLFKGKWRILAEKSCFFKKSTNHRGKRNFLKKTVSRKIRSNVFERRSSGSPTSAEKTLSTCALTSCTTSSNPNKQPALNSFGWIVFLLPQVI